MKKLLFAIFMMSVTFIGCDVPYSAPTLTINNVDRYLQSMGEDVVCLQEGFDTLCTIVVLVEDESVNEEVPVVHIHGMGVIYVFYYEDRPILRAERAMDTTQLALELAAIGRAQLPPVSDQPNAGGDQGSNGDSAIVPEGWTIRIYYPASFSEADRGLTPDTSGLKIRVVKGERLLPNNQRDLKIKNFTQIDGPNDSRSVQFSVAAEASAITIRVSGLIPGNNARFHINVDGVVSGEGTNTFQLRPVQ